MRRKPWTRSARRILICAACWTATILAAGCANVPTLPAWSAPEIPTTEAVTPIPACEFPELFELELAGETVYYMTGEGFLQQQVCLETERANHDIALQNAIALDELRQAYGTLAEQGAAQRNQAQYYLEDLEERRRATSVELWVYKGLLALVGIATVL